jgi:EAL domain-containing protein (putative c-di-GMP-specific phosphodiesterase class I)
VVHKLGIKVIAEGIETEIQRRLLELAGCNYGQGYLFSPALCSDDFERQFLVEQIISPAAASTASSTATH